MHPQSELENYKLQVELLQEKLHRSEDNRQELEGKLEQIMKKRNEHERTLRSRSQRKYQQFLDEQKKRNERNRMLVEMLERIDQQAAALSARSERLKMMKLQYELYFSKLVQSQSMKTLQSIPTTSFLPIQRPPTTYPTIKADDVVPALLNNSTPQYQTVPIPMVVPIPNDQNRFQRSWAFATAPPGVLITLANNSTFPSTEMCDNKKNESNFSFDYSQFPIGFLQAPSATTPMQGNVGQSHLQQPLLQQETSTNRYTKPLFTGDDDVRQSRPEFQQTDKSPSPFSFADVRKDDPLSNRMQQETNKDIFNSTGDRFRRNDKWGPENATKIRSPEMPNNDTSVVRQSLKVDKLPSSITPNNTFHQRTEDGRIANRGNKPNTIDFRPDNNEYIKYIKEMKETYDKNAQAPLPPLDVTAPEQHNIDNITTTLRIQKIDETNVEDDEKINDVEDNQKNTSSAFPPLGGKCSMENIGDEALTTKPLKNKAEGKTSNTAASNIDPSRDTEQITLFNGTKNSKDERTEANNRTTAIIDGVGENIENTSEGTRLDTSYRPLHFDKKEKMSIEKIETAIYGELLSKPDSLNSPGLLDKSKGNNVEEEIEQNSMEPVQNEFTSSANNLYEQEAIVEGDQLSIEPPYSTNNEQSDTKIEEVVEDPSYTYPDNTTADMQEYNNYNYSNQSQGETNQAEERQSFNYSVPSNVPYKETIPEDVQSYNYSNPQQDLDGAQQQQDYSFTEEGEQPQMENYSTDYQNYDASQYQSEYDPNAYEYNYEQQQQYNESNQAQYTPEMYNQDYQPDIYSAENANYEQNPDPSSQAYVEQQYASPEQSDIDKIAPSQQESVETEAEAEADVEADAEAEKTYSTEQTNEEIMPQKAATPTSILSTEKHSDLATKKKKRVNFVDSETDESSTLPKPEAISSESDFDFSAN